MFFDYKIISKRLEYRFLDGLLLTAALDIESIPDYDKRLYDQVKKLNRRTVRIFNFFIAGIALLLIIVGVKAYFVISRLLPNPNEPRSKILKSNDALP